MYSVSSLNWVPDHAIGTASLLGHPSGILAGASTMRVAQGARATARLGPVTGLSKRDVMIAVPEGVVASRLGTELCVSQSVPRARE